MGAIRISLRRSIGCATLAGLLVAAPAAHADTLRFNYVAAVGNYYSGAEYLVSSLPTPVGTMVINGSFWFEPTGNAFTLTVDDKKARDGETVAVFVYQLARDGAIKRAHRCVPVRTPQRYTGFHSHVEVNVVIASHAYDVPRPPASPLGCTGHAVSGIAYVGR